MGDSVSVDELNLGGDDDFVLHILDFSFFQQCAPVVLQQSLYAIEHPPTHTHTHFLNSFRF